MRRDVDARGGMQAADCSRSRPLTCCRAAGCSRRSTYRRKIRGSGPVRQRQTVQVPIRRCAHGQRAIADRPPFGRGGRPLRHAQLWPLDSHGDYFNLVRDHGGKLDQCLSALIEDLAARDMLEDTTVIAWGEFGRTPKINNGAGRDHWPKVSCAILAGGGMKNRSGDRCHEPAGRIRHRTPDPLPGCDRHALSQYWDRSGRGARRRSGRPPATAGRRPGHQRIGVSGPPARI